MTIYDNVRAALLALEDTEKNRLLLHIFADIPGAATHDVANQIRSLIVDFDKVSVGVLGPIGDLHLHLVDDGQAVAAAAGAPISPSISTNDSLTDYEADLLRQLAITRLIEFEFKKQLKSPGPNLAMLQALANNPHIPPPPPPLPPLSPSAVQFKACLLARPNPDTLGLDAAQLDCLNDPALLEKIRKAAAETLVTANILAVNDPENINLKQLAKAGNSGAVRAEIFAAHAQYGDFSAITTAGQQQETFPGPVPNQPDVAWKFRFQALAMRRLLKAKVPDTQCRLLMSAASRDDWTAHALLCVVLNHQNKTPAFNNMNSLDNMTAKIFSKIAEPRDDDIVNQRARAAIALVDHGVDEDTVLNILDKIKYPAQANAVIALANGKNVDLKKITGIIVDMGVVADRAAVSAACRAAPRGRGAPPPNPNDPAVLEAARVAVAAAAAVVGGPRDFPAEAIITAANTAAANAGRKMLSAVNILVDQELLVSSGQVTQETLELIAEIRGEPVKDKGKIIGALLKGIPGDQWKDLLTFFKQVHRHGQQTETVATALRNILPADPDRKQKWEFIANGIAFPIKNKSKTDARPEDMTPEVLEKFWKIPTNVPVGNNERTQVRKQFVRLPEDIRTVDVARALNYFSHRPHRNEGKREIVTKLAKAGVKEGFDGAGLSEPVINELYAAAGGDALFDISTINHVIAAFAILSPDHTSKQTLDVVKRLIEVKDEEAECQIIAHLVKGNMPVGEITPDFIDKIKAVPAAHQADVAKVMARITDPAQRTAVMDDFHKITDQKHKTAAVADALKRYADNTPTSKDARTLVLAFVEAGLATKGHLDERIINAILKIADPVNRDAIKAYFLDKGADKFGPSDIPRLKAAIVLAKIVPPAVPTLAILEAIKAAQSITIEKVNENQAMLSSVRPSEEFAKRYHTRTMHTNDEGDDLKVDERNAVPKDRHSVGYRSTLEDGLGRDGSGTEISEYTADTKTGGKAGSIQIEPPILTGGKLTERTASALVEYMAERGWKSINIGTIDSTVMVDVHVDGDMHQVPFKTLVYLAATAVTDEGLVVRDGSEPLSGRKKPAEMVKYVEKATGEGEDFAKKLVSELFKEDTHLILGPKSP